MYEQRPWGEYRIVDSTVFPDGSQSLVKEMTIREGCQLCYQRHDHRSETWTVISGTGEIALDGLVQQVRSGSTVKIEAGKVHAARAIGSDLHVIEIQTGETLVEEDIHIFDNYWH